MRVAGRQRHQLRSEDCGEGMLVLRPVHAQHRFDAREGRGLRRDGGGIRPQQDYGDLGVRNAGRAGDAFRRGRIEGLAVMFTDDEYLVHQIRPFFLSTSTSSATSLTITPFCRWAGGSVFTILSNTPALIPRASSEVTSRGFFLAFMMSGSFT